MPIRIIKTLFVILIFITATGLSTYVTVHLLIRGEDTVVVPELTRKEVIYALELLSDLGLDTKIKGSVYSAEVPKNHILSQDPEPGSEIKKGRDVRLVISKGAPTVILPNLVGLPLPQARIFLQENDLQQGHLSRTYDAGRPSGTILAQYPLPGRQAFHGAAIDLLLSDGPPLRFMAMMDLNGFPLNQAIAHIEAHDLTTGTIRTIRNPSLPEGMVVGQTPGFGYPVSKSATVDLTVNQLHATAENSRHSDVALFRHRAPLGFLRQHVRVSLSSPSGTMELFNAYIAPGKEIWLMIPGETPATVLLHVDGQLVDTIQR
ncbi:MAG: PASTA domain-containing protein [Desulfatitalea sp.]|nr:PASTA domain-containing protein [Desulfatitalea sp.]NNK00303.1 PASTA domain-containing protein [Desulfatitalea sp.]